MTLLNYSIEAMFVNALIIPICILVQLKTSNFIYALLLKVYGVSTRVVFNGKNNAMHNILGVIVKVSKKSPDMLIIIDDNKLKQYAFAKVRMFYTFLSILLYGALICVPAKMFGDEFILLQAILASVFIAICTIVVESSKGGCINTYRKIKHTFH